MVGRVLALVLLCAAAAVACGAGVMSAGSVGARTPGSGDSAVAHGWIIATDGRPSLNVTVLHIPPRAGGAGVGVRAADDGTVRAASALTDMPLSAAAVGDTLYLAFNGARGKATQHRLVSVRAVPVGAGALWATSPNGRMNEEPVLDHPGRLAGLAGTGAGVAALLIDDGRPSLMMLDTWAKQWKAIELPAEMHDWLSGGATAANEDAAGRSAALRAREMPWWGAPWRVVGGSRWFGVLAYRGGDDWTLWRKAIVEDATQGAAPEWTRIDVSLNGTALEGISSAQAANMAGSRVQFGVVDGELVAMGLRDAAKREPADSQAPAQGASAERAHPRMDAAIVTRRVDTSAAWRSLATVNGVSELATLAPMEAVGRLVVFWEDKSPLTRGEGERRRTLGPPDWQIAELSASSGEVFYQGKLRLPMAAATSDYRALGLVMLVVLVGAVLFVIVPIRSQELVLPDKTALASPGRRLFATAVDGFLAMLAASVIWGVPLTEVFGVEAVLTGKVIEIVATGLAIAIPVSALMEAMMGRSPGKALAGIEVVRMSRGEAAFAGLIVRPSLAMCVVRNVIKWIMPPVAMLGLLDPELRHRGDVLTRAAVVIRYEEEAEEGEGR